MDEDQKEQSSTIGEHEVWYESDAAHRGVRYLHQLHSTDAQASKDLFKHAHDHGEMHFEDGHGGRYVLKHHGGKLLLEHR